ncbi:hypothetical protein F3F96_04905 [Mariprofundus sp. NF]|uniref:hypothetical protein n=1 Tax=Mariprofundus sp. NF TaxID=2608716 RepID=UPI0015A1AC10|nr:hypothetical protein [Mariprofundus sp. NF]NWF38468.1 hypothetical protein [Mariprofundus sp. NF]
MLTLHEDAFYEFFRPYRHPQSSCDIWGGIGLETFGEDLKLVKSLPAAHLWTVVDGDGDQWILPGIHCVNRICYLVTEVAHDWRDLEFRIPARGYSLTQLGLLRQLNQARKFMGSINV